MQKFVEQPMRNKSADLAPFSGGDTSIHQINHYQGDSIHLSANSDLPVESVNVNVCTTGP